MKKQPVYGVRWLRRSDIDLVMTIDQQKRIPAFFFAEDAVSLLQRKNVFAIAVEDPLNYRRIAGYLFYELVAKKMRVLHFGMQHQDVFVVMLLKLIDRLNHQRRTMVEVDVPDWDVATQVQLRSMGLLCSHTVRDVITDQELYVFEHHHDSRTQLVALPNGTPHFQIVD